MEPSEVRNQLTSLDEKIEALRGFFDIPNKQKRLDELEEQSQDPNFWNDADQAKAILKERSRYQNGINSFNELLSLQEEAHTAFSLYEEDNDDDFFNEAVSIVSDLANKLKRQEFLSKMNNPNDPQAAILEVNGGSGGTEAQDWALMLYRMYLRWAERKGFSVEELDFRAGEEAGIKNASLYIKGDFAYGFLRSEQGVHRLVRISPFDSNARRHTSFASISVTPDIDDDIELEIDEKDLRIDTYRSSGAGGQHVNKTESAVRITHLPTGIVASCQNERSQHKNKDFAMKVLKAKLYELQEQEREEKMADLKGERKKIEFGNQIRSYVLHPYKMVKDLRTNYETSSVEAVLDGDLDAFIEEYLLSSENRRSET
ncbi:MAG: peptide chain release factor 2 [Bdellovibrionota bacterium]